MTKILLLNPHFFYQKKPILKIMRLKLIPANQEDLVKGYLHHKDEEIQKRIPDNTAFQSVEKRNQKILKSRLILL